MEKPLHLGGCGVRVGEAANPGPAVVVVANVTSLKRAWAKLLTAEADLLVVQEVRCTAAELQEMARRQICQVVYGAEVDECVLVAAFAWQGVLQKISKRPSGTAHHFKWQMGGQHLTVRSGFLQGATRQEKDHLEMVLADWLEAAEEAGEPTMVVGDFNATRDELDISQWGEAAGWYELDGLQQPATAGRAEGCRGAWTG